MRLARALVAMLALGTASIADAATRSAALRVQTLRPLVINQTRDLDFGVVVRSGLAGRVTVNPRTDARTRTGGVTLVPGGTPGAARFAVTGTPATLAQITLGARPTLLRAGGGASMTMPALTLNGPRNRRFTAAGAMDVRVGGALAVGANQMAGSYVGTFSVTVLYF